jgi:hypothetical protein
MLNTSKCVDAAAGPAADDGRAPVAERGPNNYKCSNSDAVLYVRTHDSTCDARIFLLLANPVISMTMK